MRKEGILENQEGRKNKREKYGKYNRLSVLHEIYIR